MSKDTHGNETEPTSTGQPAESGDPGKPEADEPSPAASGTPGPSDAPGTPDTQAPNTETPDGDTAARGEGTAETATLARDTQVDDTDAAEADAGSARTTVSEPGDATDATAGRSPALIATAVALPIALLVGVIVMAVVARQNVTREPLALGSVPAPGADGPACTALLPALPGELGDYTTSELVEPAPPATKAWQLPEGGEPIVLRCGLDRPLEFHRASPLQVVNGVNWFAVRDETSGVTSGTWIAVDRGTYIAVTMPDSAGPTPLQEISDAITATIPAQPLDPGELPN
ncbi:DUF3515 domain-containing protein [Nocardia otitidiscaviarum]|uniref:DUF3515 domain-containing protein n=1 Tax=Nocardia otitidiscaviarum TaxID=1823 RepID=UPI001894D3D5|nr:DUF3515 domain-containing protein [Nocardia otitidiscaviarum]MBF6182679.1 DUF3515 domain-containing protein [Nocardia otitidiscaviarum]